MKYLTKFYGSLNELRPAAEVEAASCMVKEKGQFFLSHYKCRYTLIIHQKTRIPYMLSRCNFLFFSVITIRMQLNISLNVQIALVSCYLLQVGPILQI
jgi:hypothetical protein